MGHRQPVLVDTEQSAWQLAAIQLSGWTSLPIIATSILILEVNSFIGAMMTIVVGNSILWFIRLGILAIGKGDRRSVLDIARDYLGKIGSYFIAVLLLVSTVVWYLAQTSAASTTLMHLIPIREFPNVDRNAQISILLGIVSTLFCMQGMVALRKLAVYSFPVLLGAYLLAGFLLPFELPVGKGTGLSLAGLGLILGTNLGITSELPTFFRHSRSWYTSIKALTIIQLTSLALGITSLFFGSVIGPNFEISGAVVSSMHNEILRVTLVIFVFLSVICANVANVYSASVGWEILAPSSLVGRKEYLILGLGLSTLFILLANVFSVHLLLEIADSSLVNLCLVLMVAYMMSRVTKRSPTQLEQHTYFVAWLLSTIVNLFQVFTHETVQMSSLTSGVGVILAVVSVPFVVHRGFHFVRRWIRS